MITAELNQLVEQAKSGFDNIPEERKAELEKLSEFVQHRILQDHINLIFICVHNSRRSHLSQVWAQIAAYHYGFTNVHCYSGGTEVTALYPATAEALQTQGIQFITEKEGENPVYSVQYANDAPALVGFSKLYDDPNNPQEGFLAVMVCSAADKNCPYISTAAQKILLPFEDPKAFDGTPQQAEKYLERSKQIATEMFYAFSQVRKT